MVIAPLQPRQAHADPRRLLLIFGGLVIVVIIGAAGWFLFHLRATAMANAEREVGNLSAVLAEQTARALQSVELILDAVEDRLKAQANGPGPDGKAIYEMLREKIAGVPQIKYATVIGSDGKLLYSSYSYPTLDVALGDRSYFAVHRDHPDTHLFISEPVQSRTTAESLIFVSRRLTAPNGSFAGVLTAALDPGYFENVYKSATRSEGMAISLLRDDGVMLARNPREEGFIGKSFLDRPLFQSLAAQGDTGAVRTLSGIGNRLRLFSPLAVQGYPLIVTASLDKAQVFAEWWHEARLVGTAAAAAAFAIFVLLFFLSRLFDQVASTNDALRASDVATRRQADILSTLIENLPIGVSFVGSDMRCLAFNRLFLDQAGLPPDSYKVGDSLEKLVRLLQQQEEIGPERGDGRIADRVSLRMTERRAGQPAQFERQRADGRVIDIRIIPLPGGGFVSTRTDVTAKKKIEQQLIQAQKMEAIGNITGGMAHDFNNLLGIIIGNLDLARPLMKSTGTVEELVGEALEAATRGAALTRRLLAFARRQPLRPERVDPNALATRTMRLVSRTLRSDITVVFELARDTWPVNADPGQLEAAIINLANNARDAMPHGGRLAISTRNIHVSAEDAAAQPDIAPGDYATIAVSDNGTGMPPEILNRIFEPFFTTKPHENGMGLGLSMVFGFIRQSGGYITVNSTLGAGTEFRLYLPRELAVPAESGMPAPAPIAACGGEKVLVVEDNAALRRVVTRQLGELGYRVAEADCGDTALAYLEREQVDLLFTDVVLPGTNGFALARTVAERWPAIKILLTSGFPDPKLNGEIEANRGLRLLSKPYRKEELASVLRAVLAA